MPFAPDAVLNIPMMDELDCRDFKLHGEVPPAKNWPLVSGFTVFLIAVVVAGRILGRKPRS